MNAALPSSPATADVALRERAEALSRALAAGDESTARQCLLALTPLAEGQLCATLAGVVQRLNRDLDSLPRSGVMARADLPDASQRLDHVVQLTERAAHQTLDCIEDSQRIADWLDAHGDAEVRERALALRARLRDAAAAQAYQDLTGQLLRQVIMVLANLRGSLDTLVGDVGISTAAPAIGPLLPGADDAASQGDADQMLADLGL